MTGLLHVYLLDDLVEHDTSSREPDCVCGPSVRPVQDLDGSMGWLIVHASLAGREQHEEGSGS